MAAKSPETLHPTITSAILYVLNVPRDVKWTQIEPILKSCGPVQQHPALNSMLGSMAVRTWKIKFETTIQAEMAIATLNNTDLPNVTPNHKLCLAPTPETPSPTPGARIPSLFFKSARRHPLLGLVPQELFTIFRPAGPIKAVRLNVEVGYFHPVAVLEYYTVQPTSMAREILHALIAKNRWSDCKLQLYESFNLYVSNLIPSVSAETLTSYFCQYGNVLRSRVVTSQTFYNYGFVEFSTPTEAAKALAANGAQLDGASISVRCREHQPVYILKDEQSAPPPPPPEPETKAEPRPQQTNPRFASGTKFEQSEKARAEKAREDAERAHQEHTIRLRLEEARKMREKVAQDHALANQVAEDARVQERNAKARLEVAQGIAHSAAKSKKAAVAQEEEARRKREEAEHAEREATDAHEKAQRSFQSTGYLLGVVSESLETVGQKLRSAEQAERDAETALSALLSSKKEQPASSPQRSPQKEPPPTDGGSSDASPHTNSNSEADADATEKRRLADLAESIRKMNEMRRVEELDAALRRMEKENARERQRQDSLRAAEAAAKEEREKREEQERLAREQEACRVREERERAAQEERERLAREQEARRVREERERAAQEQERRAREQEARRVREECERVVREKNEVARRRQQWKDATAAETLRCSRRDFARWPLSKRWTIQDALDRFVLVSDEFDALKFSQAVPVTVASIPWPVLISPYQLDLKSIEWLAVESFFKTVKNMLTPAQFGVLLEKSQRRFHPDRWRSRGILATVMDDGLRGALDTSGITTSQAINHLVSSWKVGNL